MQQHHSDAQRRHSGCCTALPQVSHRPERQDQGSEGPSWCRQEPPAFYDIAQPCCTSDAGAAANHSHTYHCVIDTLVIVTDTHKHVHRVLCTYMTSYLPQAYRLSILIDKQALFINCWLIRLSVDNVLLISTRRLSILSTKQNKPPVRSYRPVRLPLTTCTSPLTITRIVDTRFYHYQYVDHIPTVPLRKIGSRSR